MNTILGIGREITESIRKFSRGNLVSGGKEFINSFMEKVALELSFDECNRNCWVETEGCLNQKGLSSRA